MWSVLTEVAEIEEELSLASVPMGSSGRGNLHRNCHSLEWEYQMVVAAIEEGSIAVLGITPEEIERLLVGQSIEVVEGVSIALAGTAWNNA